MRQLRHSAKRFGHAAKRKQQFTLIAVFKYRVKVLRRELRVIAEARYRCLVVVAIVAAAAGYVAASFGWRGWIVSRRRAARSRIAARAGARTR